MTGLSIDTFGTGTTAVLVHGSLATGAEEWEAQRPLAEAGFRLIVPDRRRYGQSPSANGEDYLQGGDDIVELLGDGAHLVGHPYGCLGAMVAAARRPEATLSLALLLGTDGNVVRSMAGIALALAVCMVGGVVNILSNTAREADVSDVARPPRVLTFLGLALLAMGGIVRAASGPPILYLLLGGLSVSLFIGAAYRQKRTS